MWLATSSVAPISNVPVVATSTSGLLPVTAIGPPLTVRSVAAITHHGGAPTTFVEHIGPSVLIAVVICNVALGTSAGAKHTLPKPVPKHLALGSTNVSTAASVALLPSPTHVFDKLPDESLNLNPDEQLGSANAQNPLVHLPLPHCVSSLHENALPPNGLHAPSAASSVVTSMPRVAITLDCTAEEGPFVYPSRWW